MENRSQRILLLLVNYFNETDTCSFVREQIQAQSWKQVEVVIVDNGSKDSEKLVQLAKEVSWVSLYKSVENLGYLPGAEFGLRKYLEKGREMPDFVILSNSDIEFVKQTFFKDLLSRAERSAFDIIGPDIYSDLLHHSQNPFMESRISIAKLKMLAFLSSKAMIHYLFLTWYYSKSRLVSLFRQKMAERSGVSPVYGIHGSFMIFSRSFFEKGGTLDFPMFLFGEEVYLAEMALKAGMRVGYDADLKIIHHEHNTTGIYKSRKAVKLLNRSYRYLIGQRRIEGRR